MPFKTPVSPRGYVLFLMLILLSGGLNGTTLTDSLVQMLKQQNGEERIQTLIQLGKTVQRTQPDKSLEYYKEAWDLTKNTDLKAKSNVAYLIAYTFKSRGLKDSSIVYYDSALACYRLHADTLNIMKTSTMMGLLLQQNGRFKESALLFKNGIDLFPSYYAYHENDPTINKKHLATMMTNYGISLHKMGNYDSSLYYHLQSYGIKTAANASDKAIAKELVNIGNIYSSMDKNKKAIDYFQDANTRFAAIGDSFNIRKCYNNIGLAYKRMGDTTEAIALYMKALEISRAINSESGIATSLINLSSLYAGRNETEKSEQALNEAMDIGEQVNDLQLVSNAAQNLASLFFKLGQYDKALTLALKSEKLAAQSHERDLQEVVFELLSQIYEVKGDFKQSLAYHKQYTAIHDSLFNVDNTQRFNELQTVFETSKKEQQIALLKQEKQNQLLETRLLKNRQWYLIAVIILILIISVMTVFLTFLKRKKDKEIHRQKELYHTKEKELAKAELEKSRIKEEELQQSVLYKSKQLSTHALHMMQKNSLLHDIQSNIKILSKKGTAEDKSDFKRINFQINQSLRSDKDWDVFKLYFEEVNRDFYQKLNDLNPELTTNDHRLCALIKLNMNSKEMASVLNVAPNSIKSSRYRLKKKLGLELEADLEEFIRGL